MPASSSGIAYELHGAAGAPLVVLVHGIGLHRGIWRDYVPVLASKFRVLAYDLCGHGQSVRPKSRLSLSLLARQLGDLMDELALCSGVIVGFPLGGMINRRFAMDRPDRTRGLVILNSPHERGVEAQKLVEERVRKTADGGPGATLEASLERWFTPGFRESRPEIMQEVSDWILANDPEVFTQVRTVLATGVKELVRPDPPISCPTLVITCEHDSGSTPAMSHGIAAEIAGAETLIVPKLQHLGILEQPQSFIASVLRFLDIFGRIRRAS